MAKNRSPPLAGVRVLDLTQVLTGPFCTQILGDLGADIVKVEPPTGDGTRQWGPPFIADQSAYFLSANRNKRSIVIDLKKGPSAKEVLNKLVTNADVFIENFRPGRIWDLGYSYDVVRKLNRRIVYCSISGYGQTGPMREKPGYDIAAFAASGIMSVTGEAGRSPVKAGVPVADIGGGMYAAIAIEAALLKRAMTGEGDYIDISLYDSMISWLTFQAGIYFATGRSPVPLGTAHPIIAPYQAFKARDRYFILAVGNDSLWKKACSAMGAPVLADDPSFRTNSLRISRREVLAKKISRILSKRSAAYWLRKFEAAGVPCSPITTVKESLESKHTRARGLVLRIIHPTAGEIESLACPVKLKREKTARPRPPPLLGQHTEEILRDNGFSRKRIEELRAASIVS